MYRVIVNKYAHSNSAYTRVHSEHATLEAAAEECSSVVPFQRFAYVVDDQDRPMFVGCGARIIPNA